MKVIQSIITSNSCQSLLLLTPASFNQFNGQPTPNSTANPPSPSPQTATHQVELNTIASSFACLSTLTAQLHAHIIGRAASASPAAAAAAAQLTARLPKNNAMSQISKAMAAAVEAAGGGVVVMVVSLSVGLLGWWEG